MGIFSKIFKSRKSKISDDDQKPQGFLTKKSEKLTPEQLDEIEKKVQEARKYFDEQEKGDKKYSKKEKTVSKLQKHIEKKIVEGKVEGKQNEVLIQREITHNAIKKSEHVVKDRVHEFVQTGIPGFDQLLDKGIPKGTATLLCGGPGSGKTIFGLETLHHAANRGEKCIYMTFEENEEKLRHHMEDFGWDAKKLEEEGKLLIKKYDAFSITRSVEALLEKAKGELLIDVSILVGLYWRI
ncbi:hypothetical protein CMO83_04130 [Candidatus Woesearchaeota archaeon]|jgi:predicted ATP-dependent serine protease|nr:hypothetical protein [Candidatus Woesearchaeota archaeon]MDP6647772.1 ATPase domain-containing protein [Candidatus Woesearchaeota archaeon]|tara:strand:- start:6484 stop:7200 length:717 start_codon:yes stop_codon:yes gene_type:complete